MDTNKRVEVTEKDLEYCRQVLNESEESKKLGLQALKQLISEDDQLHVNDDEFNLIRFLRSTKYDIERAKMKLTNFYKLRGQVKEWYDNRDPFLSELQKLLKIGVFLPLKQRDEQGRLIVIIRVAAHNPYLHKQDDVFKLGLMILDLVLNRMEDTSVYGVVAIFDMTGISLGHARQLSLHMIRNAVHSWQDCYPVRVKGLHFINSPSYINVVLNIFRKFMKEKMRNRVHVHGFELTKLHETIPKKILPQEYGGFGDKLQNLSEYWRNIISKNAEWYQEDAKYKFENVNNTSDEFH